MKPPVYFHFLRVLIGVCLLTVAPAQAAFFQLAESSPSGLGNAFAGGSAIAQDASTVWYNPAGLTRLSGAQFVAGGHVIIPSTKFSKTSATTVLTTPLSGGDGGDIGEDALIANVYFSQPLDDRLVFGIGINSPFGLATEYDPDWVGRYHTIKSEVLTVNVNPSIGYKLNDAWSVGGGVNIQYADAELTQAADLGTICAATQLPAVCAGLGLVSQMDDADVKVTADDTSYGFNIGVLWQPQETTRVGLAYRSKIAHKLEGNQDVTTTDAGQATLASNPAVNLVNGGAAAYVTLPETISLSAFHQLNAQWAIMGDVTHTRWSRLPELRIFFSSGQSDSVVTLDLENVYRYSLGLAYTPNGRWTYRAGVAFDETPTPNAAVRTPRMPDEDRTWLSFGASYNKSDTVSIDFGYAYIMFDDAGINKTTTSTENTFRGNLAGTYEGDVNIVSAQVNWKLK